MPDFEISDQGTLVLFRPLTAAADEWVKENVDPKAQWFGGALVVEHRYAADLLQGVKDDGLEVI